MTVYWKYLKGILMADYTIAILGRPNVGKSTLFNRLIGSTHSIVSPVEGVTRDRIYGRFEWSGKHYNLIDTGGYLPDTMDKINSNVRLQADIAAQEADFLLFLRVLPSINLQHFDS